MDLINPLNPKISQTLTRILLIVVIACSGAVMYALSEIDKIINVQLYGYGLQADNAWLNPYHNFAWIIYGALGATILVSIMILAMGFLKTKESTTQTSFKPQTTPPVYQTPTAPVQTQTQPKVQEETKPAPAPTPTRQKTQSATEDKKTKSTSKQTGNTAAKSSAANGVCPACKKPYAQSLVMLDFEDGKSKLVNVCPNCNHVLGDSDQKTQ